MGFDSESNGGRGCIGIILRFIHGSIIAVRVQDKEVEQGYVGLVDDELLLAPFVDGVA